MYTYTWIGRDGWASERSAVLLIRIFLLDDYNEEDVDDDEDEVEP